MQWTLDCIPAKFEEAGIRPPPTGPSLVKREHVRLLQEKWAHSETDLAMNLACLRQFLKWANNPIANEPREWVHAPPVAKNRRWLDREQLNALMTAARGRERILIALEGFNGLRRIEVLRMKLSDVNFEERTLRVVGKGPLGGKVRQIPMAAHAFAPLNELRRTAGAGDRVYPHHERTADRDLMAVAKRAGFEVRVSGHDLRRSFGRIAYRNGVPLADLKNLLGHATVDMTLHYVGANEDSMRGGLSIFEKAMSDPPHPAGGQ
ncbi:MAG: site-specific integrase [Thermoplasmata archaeon]|nr:site-specific integrase [Thermoplasmata archaeon]